MAEYQISYEDLEKIVDKSIANTNGNQRELEKHRIDILVALTGIFSEEISSNKKELEELTNLWTNRYEEKSQLLFGTKYIRIHDGMVDFLEAFITGGFFDSLLVAIAETPRVATLTVGAVSSVVIAIVNIFVKAVELDDFDFCLCLRAMENYHIKKEFTDDDILEWFSNNRNNECSLHDDRWKCTHYEENDKCSILDGKISEVVSSLMDKDILDYKHEGKTKYYTLKR